jgi:predicted transcriptional regulator
MARPKSKYPTELELEILKILWDDGPLTVREVKEQLEGFRKLAHTSVITILGIMEEKAYITRTKEGGSFVYRPRIKKDSTLKRMMGDLVDRAFEGSTATAALHLLDKGKLSRDELEQLRALIARKSEEE